MPLDHVSVRVPKGIMPQLLQSYSTVLEPLGHKEMMRFGPDAKQPVLIIGMGDPNPSKPDPYLWFVETDAETVTPVHIAINVPNRKNVDECHAAAMKCGMKCNGPPGLRVHYHPNFYGAYMHDEAGNNLEFVCHMPEDCQKEE